MVTVTEVVPLDGRTADALLARAAAVERGSTHPIALSIVRTATARALAIPEVTEARGIPGRGAEGIVDGETVTVGSVRLFAPLPPVVETRLLALEREGKTAFLVGAPGRIEGIIAVADPLRPQSPAAVAALRAEGLRTVMLTGDNRATAERIAARVGVSDVRAELLPADKASAIVELGAGVAMVGDGVNDAPALAAAELGIAMGSAGSDTAIEVADVALMGDDPRKVSGLVGLARWTRSVVRQNIAFSLGTKLVAVVFLAAGALPLWAAVGTDVGASLIVVANGLRLLRRSPGGRLRGAPILQPAPRRAAAREEVPTPAST